MVCIIDSIKYDNTHIYICNYIFTYVIYNNKLDGIKKKITAKLILE